ncbi:dihydrodipicolinate synthase family protein [Glaciecola sp. 1036]|uniref:dihydrodipicolinate synthase family protein n=1 Tax=Alteromonadaceae TaxID=72275 RepID=UPI003D035866
MFEGLAAFPLTPFKNDEVDFAAFEVLIERLVSANVDSICPLGSTGLYPYMNHDEYAQVTKRAVELAGNTPVMVGIGAVRTKEVLKKAEIAQKAGVDALLLAPVSYHRLHDHEVISLYETVCSQISVPLCIYENPGVTGFEFSDSVYGSLSKLPNIGAVKIPGMPFENDSGKQRLERLRNLFPEHVAIGVSGDKFGVAGMAQGCDLWLSVVGGLFPTTIKKWISMVADNRADDAQTESDDYAVLWELFAKNKGGLRVMASAANILGITQESNLPSPLKALDSEDRAQLESFIRSKQL